MKKFIFAILLIAFSQAEALPNMKYHPNVFEKHDWGYSYRTKDTNLIKMDLTKSNNLKYYCGTCCITNYNIVVTQEENWIDSICVVGKDKPEDINTSTETKYIYDSDAKTHLLLFSFKDEDTRVIFVKLNNSFTQVASFQTTVFNK